MKLIGALFLFLILFSSSLIYAEDTKPRALKAVGGDGVVYLSWAKPKESVKGYWVYRTLPNGSYQRINHVPFEITFYKDTDVINGQFYWYTVTAVDSEGNESTPSEDAGVIPRLSGTPLSGY